MSEDTVALGIEHDQTDQVRGYVARVRRALRDLPEDDIDELTLGMEADLHEIRAESGDLVTHLGTPETYARELRAAAGLPERPGSTRRRVTGLGDGLRARWAAARRRHPWLDPVAAYLTTLRPAWWLLRGLVAAWLLRVALAPGFPGSALGILLALALVPASVWLGLHGRPRSRTRARGVTAVNAVLGVVGMFITVQALGSLLGGDTMPREYADPAPAPAPAVPGLAVDGSPVSNLFVYDAAGHPVPRARIYTDTGAPVRLGDTGPLAAATGAVDVYGRAYPNTFPVTYLTTDPADPQGVERPGDPWHPATGPDGTQPWTPPAIQPPLAPAASATPTVTPAPTTPGTAAPTTAPAPVSTSAATEPAPTAPRSGGTTTATPAP